MCIYTLKRERTDLANQHTPQAPRLLKPVWTKIKSDLLKECPPAHLSKNPSQDHGSWLFWRGRLLSHAASWLWAGDWEGSSLQTGQLNRDRGELALPGQLGRLVSGEPSDCFPDTLSSVPTHHPVICICFASYMKGVTNKTVICLMCTPWWFAKGIHCERISTPRPTSR